MKMLSLVAIVMVVAGCGAPVVTANRAEFCITYAEVKSEVRVWQDRLDQGCDSGKLKGRVCENRETARAGLRLLDDQAKAAIRQADREVDWATVGKYVELGLSLAAKAIP